MVKLKKKYVRYNLRRDFPKNDGCESYSDIFTTEQRKPGYGVDTGDNQDTRGPPISLP